MIDGDKFQAVFHMARQAIKALRETANELLDDKRQETIARASQLAFDSRSAFLASLIADAAQSLSLGRHCVIVDDLRPDDNIKFGFEKNLRHIFSHNVKVPVDFMPINSYIAKNDITMSRWVFWVWSCGTIMC